MEEGESKKYCTVINKIFNDNLILLSQSNIASNTAYRNHVGSSIADITATGRDKFLTTVSLTAAVYNVPFHEMIKERNKINIYMTDDKLIRKVDEGKFKDPMSARLFYENIRLRDEAEENKKQIESLKAEVKALNNHIKGN